MHLCYDTKSFDKSRGLENCVAKRFYSNADKRKKSVMKSNKKSQFTAAQTQYLVRLLAEQVKGWKQMVSKALLNNGKVFLPVVQIPASPKRLSLEDVHTLRDDFVSQGIA